MKLDVFVNFQYGVSADIYSLTTILYELFSGTDSFPGTIGQIFEAKQNNTKPKIPSEFPAVLKNLICQGWSKEPKKRPNLQVFKFVLTIMLREEKNKHEKLAIQEENEKAQSQNEIENDVIQEKNATATYFESSNQTMEEDTTATNFGSSNQTMDEDDTHTNSLEDQKENPEYQSDPQSAHDQARKEKDVSTNKIYLSAEQKEEQRTKGVEYSQRREANGKQGKQTKGKTKKSTASLCYKNGFTVVCP